MAEAKARWRPPGLGLLSATVNNASMGAGSGQFPRHSIAFAATVFVSVVHGRLQVRQRFGVSQRGQNADPNISVNRVGSLLQFSIAAAPVRR